MTTWNSGVSEDVVRELELFLGIMIMLLAGNDFRTEGISRTVGHRIGRELGSWRVQQSARGVDAFFCFSAWYG